MKFNSALGVLMSFFLLLASGPQAVAQAPAKPQVVAGDAQAESPLLARARALAVSTADEALKWGDKLAAVRVLSEAADLLWGDDPARSRAWLVRAWELTGEIAGESSDNTTRRYRSNPRSLPRAPLC